MFHYLSLAFSEYSYQRIKTYHIYTHWHVNEKEERHTKTYCICESVHVEITHKRQFVRTVPQLRRYPLFHVICISNNQDIWCPTFIRRRLPWFELNSFKYHPTTCYEPTHYYQKRKYVDNVCYDQLNLTGELGECPKYL